MLTAEGTNPCKGIAPAHRDGTAFEAGSFRWMVPPYYRIQKLMHQ